VSDVPVEVLPSPSGADKAARAVVPAKAAGIEARWVWTVAATLLVLSLVSLGVAWQAQQRVAGIQQELVRRQQDSAAQSTEAHMLAKQAQEGMHDTAAKVALLEARLAEVAIQRGQLEELIQSLSRSRDENVVVDIDSAIRVAMQQAAITGSAEPLVAVLKQSEERLARYNQPRLDGVRRAIARDLDKVRGVGVADLPSLSIKLDEAVRMVDDLPLLSVVEPRKAAPAAASAPRQGQRGTRGDADPSAWISTWKEGWSVATERVWSEIKSLVRVTRIDHPDAMLLAPEQAFFLRENLKLRLLNARLALLSRQFDTAQGDLALAQASLERFFDKSSKRLVLATELIRQVAAQARQLGVPRPDDTLAALAAASAGR
jgi:uroporphyrin-3 C-methyltransferase